MNVNVYLDPVKPQIDADELLIMELEKKAQIEAVQKQERLPTLTEVLYHMSEEDMLEIKDIVFDATN